MSETPFFPQLRASLAPMKSSIKETVQTIKNFTLSRLEKHFAPVIPNTLFPKALEEVNSRNRCYTQGLTFWSFLFQSFNPLCSCREVVLQIKSLFVLQRGPQISEATGAYCTARKRLSRETLNNVLDQTAKALERKAPKAQFLQGRNVKVVDGAFVTLPDTLENREKYPKTKCQKFDSGFPLMRLVVFFSLASGAILSVLEGSLHISELRLFKLLLTTLQKGDIMIADQGFGHYVALALLQQIGVDFISRSDRKVDGRKRIKSLGRNDWLVTWKKSGTESAVLDSQEWELLPNTTTVRIVRGSLYRHGFRVKQMIIATTLLDSKLYPAQEILLAYLRRWRLEMCFDDIKTTMGMAQLRCQTPEMAEKEALMYLIAHNLIRWLMLEAAHKYDVDMDRISFKGTIDALRQFSNAMAQARTDGMRKQLWEELLRTLAADLLPVRPGRREPRAIKRRHNKYPRLNGPRKEFRDPPKRNDRRNRKRLKTPILN